MSRPKGKLSAKARAARRPWPPLYIRLDLHQDTVHTDLPGGRVAKTTRVRPTDGQ
jgi:hypothetical protein